MEGGVDGYFEVATFCGVSFVDLGEAEDDLGLLVWVRGGVEWGWVAYLDPVVDLDVFVCCVEVEALAFITALHFVAAWELDIEFHFSRTDAGVVG